MPFFVPKSSHMHRQGFVTSLSCWPSSGLAAPNYFVSSISIGLVHLDDQCICCSRSTSKWCPANTPPPIGAPHLLGHHNFSFPIVFPQKPSGANNCRRQIHTKNAPTTKHKRPHNRASCSAKTGPQTLSSAFECSSSSSSSMRARKKLIKLPNPINSWLPFGQPAR